jgi:hypothetical protein
MSNDMRQIQRIPRLFLLAEWFGRGKSYSLAELEAHIERCKARGAETTLLEAALRRLRALNSN